jgi:hypothetical protein
MGPVGAPRGRWLAALAVLAAFAAGATGARAAPFAVNVSQSTVGGPMYPRFLGLAFEYSQIPQLAGSTVQSVDPVFVRLVRNLVASGRPSIRIGGLSTDRTWWRVPGMRQPPGITYTLTPRWTAAAAAISHATGAWLIPGIELEAASPHLSGYEAAQLLAHLGHSEVAAFELGNEPLNYGLIPWYKKLHGRPVPWYVRGGTPVYAEPRSWSPSEYLNEFGLALDAMPHVPLAGPGAANPYWLRDFAGRFLAPGSALRLISYHAYPLNNCIKNPSAPAYPSIPHLLSLQASRGLLGPAAPYISYAHRVGATFRIAEMGTVSCNGRAGVSDTFASALWAADALFDAFRAGVDGVNLHSYPGLPNNLFDFTRTAQGFEAGVHPLYYGALLFAQAAPIGSRLLALSSPFQGLVRAWATRDAQGHVRVLLLNDALRFSEHVLVDVAGARGRAALERLLAPSAAATGGVTLGGQTFGAQTTTGVLAPPALQAVAQRADGYAVTLPPASAALLTLPAG